MMRKSQEQTRFDILPVSPTDRYGMRIIRSDASKLILYLVSCFLLAALLTPWLYNAGTLLGEITEEKSYTRIVDYVGEHARRAELPKYFKRCLLIASQVLMELDLRLMQY